MELLSKAFGIYETNCYILRTEMGEFIIDAGVDSAKWVCENVRKPIAILNTHGHFDHIWCNAELRKTLNVPIYCPKGDAFMLKSDCFDLGLVPCAPDFEVVPNEVFRFGDIIVEFMHFAGHTPGCSMIKISGGNSSLTQSLRELEKSALDRRLALSRTDFSAQPTNLAQDTRIANDSNDSSLRGESQIHAKQSKNSPSLAEGDKGGGLKAQNISGAQFLNSDSTHPLAPSAREGEQNAKTSAREGELIAESNEIYIFSGDFIFYRTIGRSDFPYSSPSDMRDSLKRFGEIAYNATLYPGHGVPTTIKDEQKNLPFYLRGLA